MGELQLVPTRIFAHRCLDEKRVVPAMLNEGVIHNAKVAVREPFKHVFEWVHLRQLTLELSGGEAVRLERVVRHYRIQEKRVDSACWRLMKARSSVRVGKNKRPRQTIKPKPVIKAADSFYIKRCSGNAIEDNGRAWAKGERDEVER
jgi:hypothetical protein